MGKRKPSKEKSEGLYHELNEYTREELVEMFRWAIQDMATKNFLSPKERKEFLDNFKQWLLDETEH